MKKETEEFTIIPEDLDMWKKELEALKNVARNSEHGLKIQREYIKTAQKMVDKLDS